MLGIRRLILGATRSRHVALRCTSTGGLKDHTSPGALAPFAQFYRTRWPDPDPEPDKDTEPVQLPERTIPDEALVFTMKFSSEPGATIFYKHLETNPKDRKVKLQVQYCVFQIGGAHTLSGSRCF